MSCNVRSILSIIYPLAPPMESTRTGSPAFKFVKYFHSNRKNWLKLQLYCRYFSNFEKISNAETDNPLAAAQRLSGIVESRVSSFL